MIYTVCIVKVVDSKYSRQTVLVDIALSITSETKSK